VTIATRQHTYQLPFGVLQIQDGAVQGIVEKPTTCYNVSAGIYLMQSSVLTNVLITALLNERRPVGAFYFDEYWLAVEQLHHIEEAQHDIEQWSEL